MVSQWLDLGKIQAGGHRGRALGGADRKLGLAPVSKDRAGAQATSRTAWEGGAGAGCRQGRLQAGLLGQGVQAPKTGEVAR